MGQLHIRPSGGAADFRYPSQLTFQGCLVGYNPNLICQHNYWARGLGVLQQQLIMTQTSLQTTLWLAPLLREAVMQN